ncbi:MAG: tail fiber protein [Anaerolineae bacterium]
MVDPFVAEIRMFAGNFAPAHWASCDGQILPISQNTALFSLLGTYYGGNGRSTFGLPNLQGSAPMGAGQGPGLTDRFLGEQSGTPTVTLIQTEIPVHSHPIRSSQGFPDSDRIQAGTAPGAFGTDALYNTAIGTSTTMSPQALTVTGSSQPHNNMQPYLTVFFIIALQGVFPPRG